MQAGVTLVNYNILYQLIHCMKGYFIFELMIILYIIITGRIFIYTYTYFAYLVSDFYKLGGFAILPICLGSENDKIRSRASSILAELCQNNPFCQARALECGLFNVMLHLAPSEKGMALAKCISAISCKIC